MSAAKYNRDSPMLASLTKSFGNTTTVEIQLQDWSKFNIRVKNIQYNLKLFDRQMFRFSKWLSKIRIDKLAFYSASCCLLSTLSHSLLDLMPPKLTYCLEWLTAPYKIASQKTDAKFGTCIEIWTFGPLQLKADVLTTVYVNPLWLSCLLWKKM